MHDDEIDLDVDLARQLVEQQFPQWAELELTEVTPWGTDNAIWRLGPELVLRFPRIAWAKTQPELEDRWLPILAPHLPVAVPEPVGLGAASDQYLYAWSVHRWIPGVGAGPETIADPMAFAEQLVGVVQGLRQVPTDGAPAAHNRARPLAEYDRASRKAIKGATGLIDTDVALAVWEDGLEAAPFDGATPWVHGDLEGNCLLNDGQLSGIVDWGSACAGDPAVDVQVAWSPLFTEGSREYFLDALQVDDACIRRAKAMAINQTCGALPYYLNTYPLIVERSWHKLAAVGVPCFNL